MTIKGMKRAPLWSKAEDATLKAMWRTTPQEEIVARLRGRTWKAINTRSRRLRLRRWRGPRSHRPLTIHPLIRELYESRRDQALAANFVAKAVGLNAVTLSVIENGTHKPTFDTLIAWAETLGFELVLRRVGAAQVDHVVARLQDRVKFSEATRKIQVDLVESDAMTTHEWKLLRHLVVHAPGPRTKDQLHHALYADAEEGGPSLKIIDVFVCKVRAKLNGTGLKIGTVWGGGYYVEIQLDKHRRAA